MDVPLAQLRLRLSGSPGERPADAVELERFAQGLRAELLGHGVARVDRAPGPPAPEGARGIELVGAVELVVSVVSTGASLLQTVDLVRKWRAAHGRRRAVAVEVEGVDIDAASPSSPQMQRIVDTVHRRAAPRRGGDRRALIVANSGYADPALSQLRSPGRDADELAEVLGSPGIGGFAVDLLTDADERTVRRRVAAFFADRDPDDLLLLHFSCHGLKDADGQLYLAAADTELAVLTATGVPAAFVSSEMSRTASRRVVLILDCCYSGAFARGAAVRGDSQVHVNDYFTGGAGRTVLTASSATEYAFEDGQVTRAEERPSVFTGALVTGLRSGEADLNGDGEVTIDELYDYAYRSVLEQRSAQRPQKWSFGTTGALVIARSTRLPALPEQIASDLASDRLVLRLHAVESLGDMLAADRSGAREAAAAALADLRDNDDSIQVRTAAANALGTAVSVPPQRSAEPPPAHPQAAPREAAPPNATPREAVTSRRPRDPPPQRAVGAPQLTPDARALRWLRLAGWLGLLAGVFWFIGGTSDDFVFEEFVNGHVDDIVLAAQGVIIGALAVLMLAGPPGRRAGFAATLLGASLWAVPFVASRVEYLYESLNYWPPRVRGGLLTGGQVLTLVAAVCAIWALRERAAWTRIVRPTPALMCVAGMAAMVIGSLLSSIPFHQFIFAFIAIPVVLAGAVITMPAPLAARVAAGFAGAGLGWLAYFFVTAGDYGEDHRGELTALAVLLALIAALARRMRVS